MSERPPIQAQGEIVNIREEQRLFDVKMPNGYVAIAVLHKDGPECPDEVLNRRVEVLYSPYDMSRCRIVSWG